MLIKAWGPWNSHIVGMISGEATHQHSAGKHTASISLNTVKPVLFTNVHICLKPASPHHVKARQRSDTKQKKKYKKIFTHFTAVFKLIFFFVFVFNESTFYARPGP